MLLAPGRSADAPAAPSPAHDAAARAGVGAAGTVKLDLKSNVAPVARAQQQPRRRLWHRWISQDEGESEDSACV